jgi:predicted N-acetyltransferase YhbS
MFQVSPEKPEDHPKIEALLDQSFGPARHQRAAYCLRGDGQALAELCFVMRGPGFLCASIRYWPVLIDGRHDALLLGPLAVGQAWRNRGFGKLLISHSLSRAKAFGHDKVLVIGEKDYYQPFGFSAHLAANLALPKAAKSGCFQACELIPGALDGLAGDVSSG